MKTMSILLYVSIHLKTHVGEDTRKRALWEILNNLAEYLYFLSS